MAIQQWIITAQDKISKSHEIIITTTKNMEKLRAQELLMRSFIEVDEQACDLKKGAREDLWCQELINHIHKAASTDG